MTETRQDPLPKQRERTLVSKVANRCKVCGHPIKAYSKDDLCAEHSFLFGEVWTLDMSKEEEKWKWELEIR